MNGHYKLIDGFHERVIDESINYGFDGNVVNYINDKVYQDTKLNLQDIPNTFEDKATFQRIFKIHIKLDKFEQKKIVSYPNNG